MLENRLGRSALKRAKKTPSQSHSSLRIFKKIKKNFHSPHHINIALLSESPIQFCLNSMNKVRSNKLRHLINRLQIENLEAKKSFSYQHDIRTDIDLRLGYCPTHLRNPTTVIIRKHDKDDYTDPLSYRPIALLYTIAKALESILASRISFLVEEHNLLPVTLVGGRKAPASMLCTSSWGKSTSRGGTGIGLPLCSP